MNLGSASSLPRQLPYQLNGYMSQLQWDDVTLNFRRHDTDAIFISCAGEWVCCLCTGTVIYLFLLPAHFDVGILFFRVLLHLLLSSFFPQLASERQAGTVSSFIVSLFSCCLDLVWNEIGNVVGSIPVILEAMLCFA